RPPDHAGPLPTGLGHPGTAHGDDRDDRDDRDDGRLGDHGDHRGDAGPRRAGQPVRSPDLPDLRPGAGLPVGGHERHVSFREGSATV
ncbi:MAG: hypothetical protein AVDCRST_MAG33-1625, partial [uncultured Thermomicrobiales bacterium]